MKRLAKGLTPDWFKPETPLAEAKKELLDAELQLLRAHSAREYAAGMISYREAQVNRLRKYIASIENR